MGLGLGLGLVCVFEFEFELSKPPSHTGETEDTVRRPGVGTKPNIPGPPRVGGAHGLRTGVLNHTRIAPSVAPSVMTGALWRQAVRVCTRGRGSEMMS